MARRPTIEADAHADRRPDRLRPGPLPRNQPKPVKVTVSISAEVADEWRDAVFYLRMHGEAATLTGLIVDSVDGYLEPLRRTNGGTIPARGARDLSPGPLSR